MRNPIRCVAAAALALIVMQASALAKAPSVADLDAADRAAGNRMTEAKAVGEKLFATQWPAQIFRVSANGIGDHIVIGLGLYGVKFHGSLTRGGFTTEIAALVSQSFTAAPNAEEVDIWTVVPIAVGKGVIVNGDLAKPTTRTVFTASVLRPEAAGINPSSFTNRPGVYWDEDWTRTAFKKAPL
ncbi:MAG: hypothetical protein M3R51_00790 [Candidatus Eremiobacteraeota bacterium]|nr:hypothetical protein [Candidatus Eremiobacteraeota bacterium]